MPRRIETGEENAIGDDSEQVELECSCGRTVALQALPEYETPTFVGACPCGRVWSLTELSRRAASAPEAES